MRNLLAHQGRLLGDLLRELGILGGSLVYDDAERRLERMRKVADMGARALHHAPVGFDQRVKLLLKRQNLIGRRSLQQRFLARADRGQALADVLERAHPEPHLEKGCQQKAPAKQRKREHNGIGKVAGLGIDGRGVEGYR